MMKKKANKKGFTIMEMLIVVAIIAVLAAIAIPTFTSALEKSKESADVANIRSAYAEVQVKVLTEGLGNGETVNGLINTALENTAGEGKVTASKKLNYPEKYTFDDDKITYTAKKLKNDSNNGIYTWSIKTITID